MGVTSVEAEALPCQRVRQGLDQFSTVHLPENLPQVLLETLRNVMIAGQKLQLSQLVDSRPARDHDKNSKCPHIKPRNKSKSKPKHRPQPGWEEGIHFRDQNIPRPK